MPVPIHAATTGGEEANIIVQELGEEHQLVRLELAHEALPTTIGSRELPEALDGPNVLADDDDWMSR